MKTELTLIVMGVTGSGKTTVGERLALHRGCVFLDADDFHPEANVAKMASGVPLDDADRWPWLRSLRDAIGRAHATNDCVVVACSALKSSYREELRRASGDIRFIYLRVDRERATNRLQNREGHFMPAGLVESQFDALEEPTDAIVVDASKTVEDIVTDVLLELES